ncbi:MAG: polymerase, sigma-24 subunit, subfamily [Myxococcales bacterium]|nr:polymerase, sigma-24 subunit, subfamily [Myxococcales bacterium]
MERIVHVCNGDSTADILSLADLPGEIRVWADSLDQGPVLPLGDQEHYKVRNEFWASRGFKDSKLAAWDQGVDEAAGAEELILWYEHDLFDQLALIRLLSRLARRGLPSTLTIVSIDRHPEVPNFLGFGQLKPEQLAELWPRRTPLSRDAIDEAITAWIAITSADPRAIPYLTRRIKALPFLAGALERHLEEFPDPTSGMSRTERQVLAAVARGEATEEALMLGSQAIDPRYPLTDLQLFDTLKTLAQCGFLEGAPASHDKLKTTNATITPLGRQALAGAIDRVHEVGIDTWRGGVHLTGKGPVWRWDSRERKLIER